MSGVNRVTVVGNLGKDPEMRYLPSGSPVTNFSVAVTRRWKSKTSGEFQEETEWFNVVAFDRLAEIANEYLKKGKQVYVEGRQKTDKQDDPNGGKPRYYTKLIANEIQMLGTKKDGAESSETSETFFPF